MRQYSYDFHLHTCLSPCGEQEMTPYNIVAFAKVLEVDLIAITDHNSCGNCRSAMKAGELQDVLVIPGMELSTAEDMHMVCLFPTIDAAEEFSRYVSHHQPAIQNRPEIYGTQLYMDHRDRVIGTEQQLLINATTIPGYQAVELVEEYQGICYPAHVDRPANSLLSILGGVDESMKFTHFELTHEEPAEELFQKHPLLQEKVRMHSSDAHWLGRMANIQHRQLPLETRSISAVFDWFRKSGKK